MLRRLLAKLLNAPTAIRLRLSPHINRFRLRLAGVSAGRNAAILGRPYILVGGGVKSS